MSPQVPHNPFTDQKSAPPLLTNLEKAYEMGRRVGLTKRLVREIFMLSMSRSLRMGEPNDMVFVARGIMYVSMNKDLLRPQWRV
jgi:hypothetical protein